MARIAVEPDEIRRLIREELEMAWLRGYGTGVANAGDDPDHSLHAKRRQEAADYAERVVRGSIRPERPEVEQ